MLVAVYVTQVALMLALPLGLWWALRRRAGASWRLIGVGALTFVASQVVHIPVVYGLTALLKRPDAWHPPPALKDLFNAVILGLLAGLCEELARWVVLRAWLKRARSFRAAVTFGAGHGGCEALILGALAAIALGAMLCLRGGAAAKLHLTTAQSDALAKQLAAYWSVPLYLPVLAAVERVVALTAHVALTTLVMQCFARRRLWPLALAIGWHALVDGTAVIAMARLGIVPTEALVAASAPVSLLIVGWSRRVLPREAS